MKPRPLALVVALAVPAALAGCVSLLPKSKPAQLYRFGYRPKAGAAAATNCPAGGKTGVILAPPDLPRGSGGDQLLTVTGDEAAFIADSRWLAPAAVLFQTAVDDAFQSSCQVRLVRRADSGAGSLRMRLDVERFETEYAAPGAAPTVKVSITATLLKQDGDFGDEATFQAASPASDNRVGAIVTAYSAASSQALLDLRAWTEARAPQIGAQQIGAQATRSPPTPDRPAPALGQRSVTSSSTTTSTTAVPR